MKGKIDALKKATQTWWFQPVAMHVRDAMPLKVAIGTKPEST